MEYKKKKKKMHIRFVSSGVMQNWEWAGRIQLKDLTATARKLRLEDVSFAE